MERGEQTQVSGGNKRAGEELISWEKHRLQDGANEADAGQVQRVSSAANNTKTGSGESNLMHDAPPISTGGEI